MTKVDELREALAKRKASEETQHDDSDANEVIKELEEKLAAEHERLLRSVAEVENAKKRNDREKADAIAFANEKLLKEMMVILDHLDEALSHVPTGDACPEVMRAFVEGMDLTFRQFTSVLKQFGFEEIGADAGTLFDPSIHEAVGQIDAEDVEKNCIVTRQRRGYVLHGRVLRAALVIVAK